jgi:hypothetical protein
LSSELFALATWVSGPPPEALLLSRQEPLIPAQKSMKNVTPADNEWKVDHIDPESQGGSGDPSNGDLLCGPCNDGRGKHDNTLLELYEIMGTFPNGGIPG